MSQEITEYCGIIRQVIEDRNIRAEISSNKKLSKWSDYLAQIT